LGIVEYQGNAWPGHQPETVVDADSAAETGGVAEFP